MLVLPFLTTSNTWLVYSTSEYQKDIDIGCRFCQELYRISISFWYSAVPYTSRVLEGVKNAENDIFSLVSSYLMSIFGPNIGHQEKIISKS